MNRSFFRIGSVRARPVVVVAIKIRNKFGSFLFCSFLVVLVFVLDVIIIIFFFFSLRQCKTLLLNGFVDDFCGRI